MVGEAGKGVARLDRDWQESLGKDRPGWERSGEAGLAGQGPARSVREWIGRSRWARPGEERTGRKGRSWAVRNGLAGKEPSG